MTKTSNLETKKAKKSTRFLGVTYLQNGNALPDVQMYISVRLNNVSYVRFSDDILRENTLSSYPPVSPYTRRHPDHLPTQRSRKDIAWKASFFTSKNATIKCAEKLQNCIHRMTPLRTVGFQGKL
jgi:hypothetical protein